MLPTPFALICPTVKFREQSITLTHVSVSLKLQYCLLPRNLPPSSFYILLFLLVTIMFSENLRVCFAII